MHTLVHAASAEVTLHTVSYRFKPLSKYVQECRSTSSLVYYVKGGHRFVTGDRVIETHAGEALYIPQASAYTNYTLSDDTEYFQVDFNLHQNGKICTLFDRMVLFPKEESVNYLPIFREIYQIYAQRDTAFRLHCIANILRIIALIAQTRNQHTLERLGAERIGKTISYLNEYYYLNTSVQELADLSSVCVSSLEKSFKNCLGMTPLMYRNKLRMEHAKLLLAGGCSIEEACSRVGVSDIYYFSRLFKQFFHISPGAYAKQRQSL